MFVRSYIEKEASQYERQTRIDAIQPQVPDSYRPVRKAVTHASRDANHRDANRSPHPRVGGSGNHPWLAGGQMLEGFLNV